MDEIFKKFYSRLKKEGIFKAALCAAAISFGAVAVTAFICWMTEFSPVWILPVVFAASAGITFTLFYLLMFRPDFKTTAARIDALGLDERMITMHEFANSNSEIATIQRADAMQKSKKLSTRMLEICVPLLIVVLAAVAELFCAAMVTVDALSEVGVIKSGKVIAEEIANPPAEYTLRYRVVGQGTLRRPNDEPADEEQGEEAFFSSQRYSLVYAASSNTYYLFSKTDKAEDEDGIKFTLSSGEFGELVRATPEDGWFLAGWQIDKANYVMQDDYRQDGNLTQSVIITAVYEQLEKPVDEIPPTGPGGGGGGFGGGSGTGSGNGITRSDAGFVIDGNTWYGDTYGDDFNHAMQNGSGNESLSQGEAGIVGDYFGTIAP